ncbi:hypothetical protein N9Q19_00200 [Puniceicoccaceae bacterium]|nr:hypothetical protein [Puniceicoccaceae bacterium]
MKILTTILSFSVIVFCSACSAQTEQTEQTENAEIEPFVHWLLDDGERLEDVRFAEVAEAVSGCKVLAVDSESDVDLAMLRLVESALSAMLAELASADHPIHEVGRVNEISRHVEDSLPRYLNEAEGYACTIPPNASGKEQRSGYPDLRLLHETSGCVFYIDPKVYKAGSETSTSGLFTSSQSGRPIKFSTMPAT